NTYNPGCITVTKNVDWAEITPDPTQTFTICIQGPSYPTGDCYTFGHNGGTHTWTDLIPGDYDVYEMDPGSEWLWDNTRYTVTVYPGSPCACIIFYNEYNPGCLEVYKTVNWNGIAPFPMDFVIEVRGPAPDTTLVATLHFDEYGNPIGSNTISPLIPGDYTITEINPGSEWEIIGSPQTITVYPGTPCATATIYNTRIGLEIVKEVWDESSSSWVDFITVPIHTILNFKITITCTGGSFHDIVVTDTLSTTLEYRNNANHPEYYVSPDLREVIWKFSQLNSGETITIYFDAETVATCSGWNHVEVTTQEQVIHEDTVIIKTIFMPEIIQITKEVWDGTQWADSATFSDTNLVVQFKITVTNLAPIIDLTDVLVTDDLPSFLSYSYSLPVFGLTPIIETPNHVEWFTHNIPAGKSMYIIYYATINSAGVEGDNYAFGIANYGTDTVSDYDSTHIIIN
ncbi:MAG: hypothetical protein JSV67_04980, partial [Thermoplasmatales archaeon]